MQGGDLMKEENNNSAGVWITVTVGVVLLYLLSPGPVRLFYQNTHRQPPKWITKVYYPLETLYNRSETVNAIYNLYFQAIGIRKNPTR